MIVDTHQHAFWQKRDDRGLIVDMDEHGIDAAWLLSWDVIPDEDAPSVHAGLNPEHRRPDGSHPGIPISDLIKTRDRYPDRFVIGYCPHPVKGNAPAYLEAAHYMHGARVCGECKFRIPFDDPRSINLYRKAGELNMPVVLHLDVPFLPDPATKCPVYQANWYGGTVAHLERALQACPETSFVGHAPGFWREISADADSAAEVYPSGPVTPGGRLESLLSRHANLYADLSAGSALRALKRDVAYSKDLLCRFSDRFLFARDYYGSQLMDFLGELSLGPEVTAAIMGGNAQRLVPLKAESVSPPLISLT